MMRAAVLIAALAAAATPASAAEPPPAEEPDAFVLDIQIGRLGVLNAQALEALGFLREAGAVTTFPEDAETTPRQWHMELYRIALELNVTIGEACGVGGLSGDLCAFWWRDWLVTPGKDAFSAAETEAHATELQGAVLDVHGALCAAAEARGQPRESCMVE